MKQFLEKPGFLGTYGTMGADLSVVLAVLFTLLFIFGWRLAKKGKGQAHHIVTLWAMVLMLTYFVAYYISRQLGALAFEGKEGFGGPEVLYKFVFSPLLTIHITVVSFGIVMAFYMILLGFRASRRTSRERVLVAGPPLWGMGRFSAIVLIGSVVVSALLFALRGSFVGFTFHLFSIWFEVFFTIGLFVVLVEGIGRKLYPDGERRHRALGTFTMSLYVVALVTSVTTYMLIYVLYPPKIG
ncbi:MAG: DUF420 domain-containing protein [Nitrospirae bacterium]|nr:DUF420 domain-containing protein [Nitrospirota bacterium]